VLIGGAVTAFTVHYANPAAEIALPVNVFPPDGTSQHVESVTVEVSDASSVDRLWVRAHNVADHHGNPNMVSIRINGSRGGEWVDINNSNVTCHAASDLYGCVGGAYATLRFTLPATNVVDGANTIDFRFNGSTGLRSGFRVLDFDFLPAGVSLDEFGPEDVGTRGAIDGTSFSYEDPTTWSAPEGFGSSTDIQNGEDIWSTRGVLVDGPSGEQIRASCSDCHARDGRDLKYFNYSNESIISRSRFHGLSETQGRQIAAYIRSRTLRAEDGSTYEAPGRPWNPPYQPGQGLDDNPVHEWAAGAGLKAVLDNGEEAFQYMFPNGITKERVATDNTLNMRELPVALQFADWNKWLPIVHPIDSYPSRFPGGELESIWTDDRSSLFSGEPSFDPSGKAGSIRGFFETSHRAARDLMNSSYSGPKTGVERAEVSRSVLLWELVRTWETVHRNSLENDGKTIYGNQAEKRTWPTDRARTVFDISPHISGNHGEWAYGTETRSDFYDHEWYYKQIVINPGNRLPVAQDPMDWKYHFDHIYSGAARYGAASGTRHLASYVKMMQMLDNDKPIGTRGWMVRHITPFWLWQHMIPAASQYFSNRGFQNWSTDRIRKVSEAVLGAHMDKTLEYDISEFPRGGDADSDYGTESTTPDPWGGSKLAMPGAQSTEYATHYYRLIQMLETVDVDPALLGRVAEWGEKMWPNGDWEQWIGAAPTTEPPTVSLTAPSDGASYTPPATVSLTADASDPDGSITSVRFFANGTEVAEVTSAPYEFTWTDVPEDSYSITAEATDDAGATATSSSAFITVAASGTALNGVHYDYFEGSWSQLPDFDAESVVKNGQTTTFTLGAEERGNSFGFRFTSYVEIPASESGTYTFSTTSDDGSKLFVDGAPVVTNDGIHAMETQSGTVSLSEGWHKIVVEYFERDGGEGLDVRWSGPGVQEQSIPASRLFLSPGSSDSSQQQISLSTGWNVISSHVAPTDSAMGEVFSDTERLVLVKDEEDAYIPDRDLNDIGAWDSDDGYQVFVETGQSLTLSGPMVPVDTPVELVKGWNILPYYPRSEMEVSTALASLDGSLVIVKDEEGNSYIPDLGINNIGTLVPGQGYKIYVSSPVTFTYPTTAKASVETSSVSTEAN
jgi:hypothetical protein